MRVAAATCLVVCGLPFASCVDGGSVWADATVAVHVAPLTLPGVTDAAWRITVENAQGDTVFTRDVDSRGYGAGDGSLAYVGPCDADQNDNTVTLELLSLHEGAGGAVLIDPASYHDPGPIARGFTCLQDVDVAVDFDITGDGAANCIDGCPSDVAKTAPGVCGCGTADSDSDGDGTADCIDGCPTDPAKTAPGACGCGVAEGCNGSVDVAATGQGHSNLVRIDSTSFAVAYTDDPDRAVAPTSFKVRIGQLVGGTFTWALRSPSAPTSVRRARTKRSS